MLIEKIGAKQRFFEAKFHGFNRDSYLCNTIAKQIIIIKYIPYIKPGYVTKEGTTPLYIRYNYNRIKRILIPTGYSIKPQHWNKDKKWIRRNCLLYEEIEACLIRMMSKLGKIITYARDNHIDPTIDFVQNELMKDREYELRPYRVDMFDELEKYIVERASAVSKDQIKDYRTLRKHLVAFKQYSSQPIAFNSLNLTFYNEFMEYLFYKAEKTNGTKGLLTNTAGKIIRLLKSFVNYEIDKKVIPAINLKCFKVVEEEIDAIYLNEEELAEIYNLDLSNNNQLEEIRDIFIVGCFTGLRYSDLSNLGPEHIDSNRENIILKQRKVHRSVIIPMIDYVPNILKKYNYKLPKYSSYIFNERVKEIGKMAGLNRPVEIVRKKGKHIERKIYQKWELIYSHTCRRSFCTNMYLMGIPVEELMRISGHKSLNAFIRYIRVGNLEAANKLKSLRNNISK